MKPRTWQAYFFRTLAGAEIDLLLIDEKGSAVAVEVKYSLSPKPARGFWVAYGDLGCSRGYVLYPGEEEYPVGEGVRALPLASIAKVLD